MSEQPAPPADAEATDDISVATRQAALGEQWAGIYANPKLPIDNRAEMILANPAVYVGDIDPAQLPGDLPAQWQKLLGYCDTLADQADTETATWSPEANGLEKVKKLVQDGRINPDLRTHVGFVIRNASNLFAGSVEHLPGNTAYYQENLDKAEISLHNHPPSAA